MDLFTGIGLGIVRIISKECYGKPPKQTSIIIYDQVLTSRDDVR